MNLSVYLTFKCFGFKFLNIGNEFTISLKEKNSAFFLLSNICSDINIFSVSFKNGSLRNFKSLKIKFLSKFGFVDFK